MEPMVVFSAGLVAYYAYRAVRDALHDVRRDRAASLLEKAARQAQAPDGRAAVTHVVGLEKLSKILALHNKKFPQDATAAAPAGCGREHFERFFAPHANRLRTGVGVAHAFSPKR